MGGTNTISSWSYDMEGHAKKCVDRYCELANKTTEQLFKVKLKEEDNGSVGELSTVCSQIVLKCLSLARIGRPYILWSVNKLARAVTKWTKACDKRLARLISYIHHTSEFVQKCNVGNIAQQCRLGWFQDSDFAGDLEDSKSTSGFFVFCKSNICTDKLDVQKKTSVSHSSTEAELISLNAGLCMDGTPALDLWDLVIEVFHSSPTRSKKTKDQAHIKQAHPKPK